MEAMTHSGKAEVTLPADDQIKVVREFDAPANLVYRAVTEPELVERWWGAQRGAMTVAEIDLRVGGKWRYVMDASNGQEVGFHGEFREIVPNERIVQTEAYEGIPNPDESANVNTMTLVEADGRTTMEVLIQCVNKESRDMQIASGMEEGMQESYDDLEDVAKSLA
ncbi:MAG TPA: SRPBCC family protein [Solirubrobacterales bacterium]